MYQGTGEPKNFQSSKSGTHELKKFQSSKSSSHVIINQCSSTITSTGVMAQMSNVNHFQLKSSTGVMTLITRCQSPTIKVKYKCDDLVNQSSVNHQQ